MKLIPELREACAANAAMLGAAFISGREAASFFAVAGWASWAGIAVSSVLFGALMGMLCNFARITGAATLPGIYYSRLDERCGDAISVVHALLMLMMGAVALSTAGELGLLSLNLPNPVPVSALVTLLTALALTCRGMRPLSSIALVTIPACILFFAALALDPRPSGAGVFIEADIYDISGNLPAAVFLGALFAFLKSAMAGGVAAARSRGLAPRKFGVCCGAILALVAGTANWALHCAGPEVWGLSLPSVVLAARWGVAGYYLSIYVMWLGCISLLSCAIGSLTALFSARVSRPAAALFTSAGIALMSVTGLKPLVSVGYPMLGWLCAICLGALAVFCERRPRRKAIAPSSK